MDKSLAMGWIRQAGCAVPILAAIAAIVTGVELARWLLDGWAYYFAAVGLSLLLWPLWCVVLLIPLYLLAFAARLAGRDSK
jgi:uncharacterized membrane protein